MKVLGLSFGYHDAAAAVVVDGTVVAADQEERFTRIKHDSEYPANAIDFCMREADLHARDLDAVVYYEKTLVKLDRIVKMTRAWTPSGARVFDGVLRNWIAKRKLNPQKLICERLGIGADRVVSVGHHAAHAASAFYPSPFDAATVVTLDGIGEYETASVMVGRDRRLEPLSSNRFPHSIGLLYSAFTAYLGFEVNDAEYKVMGMAAFGEPRHVDAIHALVNVAADATFTVRPGLLNLADPQRPIYTEALIEMFGPPRPPEAPFGPGGDDSTQAELEMARHYADVAASLQAATERWVLEVVDAAVQKTGIRAVCMSGGVALNSLANSRVKRELGVDLYVQPAAGDSGSALGAALHYTHATAALPRTSGLNTALLGARQSDDEIEQSLRQRAFPRADRLARDVLVESVARALHEGKVIAWYQGRAEWGPRALGCRSILANPTLDHMQDTVNRKVKYREPFRPFAPSVLCEAASTYFDIDPDTPAHAPENFMLSIINVRAEHKRTLPAITHIDGTARVQLVRHEVNPLYYDLIRRFGELSGVPVLLNTSLNLRGQPMAGEPWNAMEIFSYSGIDCLAVGPYFYEKRDLPWAL